MQLMLTRLTSQVTCLTSQVTKLVKALHHCPHGTPGTTTTAATTASTTRTTGTVKWYDVYYRYGFIKPHHGGPDVFVHRSNILFYQQTHCHPSLADRETVSFILREGRRGPYAVSVTGPDGRIPRGSPWTCCPPVRYSDGSLIHYSEPVQVNTLQCNDDSVTLPPAPQFDGPLPPPQDSVAQVAAISTTVYDPLGVHHMNSETDADDHPLPPTSSPLFEPLDAHPPVPGGISGHFGRLKRSRDSRGVLIPAVPQERRINQPTMSNPKGDGDKPLHRVALDTCGRMVGRVAAGPGRLATD